MNLKGGMHNERIVIEQELYKIITLINESDFSDSKKEKLREEAFIAFHRRVQNYKGAPKFKTMTVEDIKALYEDCINPDKGFEQDI